MSQTRAGILKIMACRAGLTVEEFAARTERGLGRCWGCEKWFPVTEFDVDRSRWNGRAGECKPCKATRTKAAHKRRRTKNGG